MIKSGDNGAGQAWPLGENVLGMGLVEGGKEWIHAGL
eukprot:CAMPEP_0174350900 /NCGR_PEP_ID=MMETSP0811_2-20130205/8108_1 /TAXON_ID=73025 ORGANISM="Eutreptiella gymnastica-like, Strain CCMP1594" /NCGR_SAMPLE_ID=MMETSP0811_2 /ASSEMBLY_ACC=CAM_ASM_000667 /LENGTH=36 /DNA_ID= /DNA_START= /DNA_END= /DNA_ORIENTATION=